MANQHSSRQSWVAADMRPVRNSRQHLAASTNENRRQSPRTLQEKSRAPLLSGNPHIGKRPPHTASNANACPTPHQSGDHSLVALAGKMVHQSITMSMEPQSAALDCHEPEAEIAARDAPMALQARRDTRNGSRRDDKHAPAGPEYRHGDRSAGCLEGEAAFGTPPHANDLGRPAADLRYRGSVSKASEQSGNFRFRTFRPPSRTRLTSVIFSEPLLLCQSRKRRENWKCHQRG
jgi:hypothetical protein